jgi:hypothetical protein
MARSHINRGCAVERVECNLVHGCGSKTRQRQVARLGARRVEEIGEREVRRCGVDDDNQRRMHETTRRVMIARARIEALARISYSHAADTTWRGAPPKMSD